MTARELAKLRQKSGVQSKDLAAKIGVDNSTLWRWEHGESEPSAPALRVWEEELVRAMREAEQR